MNDYSFLPAGGPLSAVQLIPIINYLNILSEFLFVENYLPEVNQNKQIPIINALYDYLEDNRENTSNKVKLIRRLLKGSDLYGESYTEKLNIYFVHRMFDYIISSLVFNKYGNIYGFLANVVRKSKNLQYNNIMKEIKLKLKEEKFENEYGIYSKLTDLAVGEIYQNLIKPLFPENNLNLLSFDYIFAQAGLNYIQFGLTNRTSYFPNLDNTVSFGGNFNKSFNECLALGHLIKILLDRKSIDPVNVRVFALPALFYYLTTELNLEYKRIEEIVFEPKHWMLAYDKFFHYLQTNLEKIDELMMKDYNYKIHVAFSNFQSIVTMTRYVIDLEYRHLMKYEGGENFSQQIVSQSNINNWFRDQIHNFGEIFGRYELERSRESFRKFLPEDLDDVVITLLYSNNPVLHGDLHRLIKKSDLSSEENCFKSYDLFEFYFTGNETYEYYALVRENYTVQMVKLTEDDNFGGKVNISLNDIIKSGHRVILKYANETSNDLAKELMNFKKERFTSYLHYSEEEMKNNDWWKEFGLSLVPRYPCLQNRVCEKNNLKFLNQFKDDVSLYLTNENTKTLLDSLGMRVRTIFLRDTITNIIYGSEWSGKEPGSNDTYDRFALNFEEPSFIDEATTKNDIVLMTNFLYTLSKEHNEKFDCMEILNSMQLLKSGNHKTVYGTDLFVKMGLNKEGYGYKFSSKFFKDGRNSNVRYGVLRREYDFKKLVFVIPSKIYRNTFILLVNETLDFEGNRHLFEIYHQLRGKSTTVVFSGVSSNYTDVIEKECDCQKKDNCSDDENYCQGRNFGKDEKIEVYPNRNQMFEKLLYEINLDRRSITIFEGEQRIGLIYTYRERKNIEGETKLENMIDNYNEQRAYNLVIFEEYYAIRNFVSSGGEERIQRDSEEAKQMKIALYRLAIRQYEEKKEAFSGRLFRFDTKTVDYVTKELYVGKPFILQKFTTTSTNVFSAARFVGYPAEDYRIILYDFKFNGPYFRSIVEVKVEQFEPICEKKIILLPGSSFTISHISIVTMGGIGNVMKVQLTLDTNNAKKN